jgi:glutamyl/glutaminyl-tRNA synthetase
MKFQNRVLLAMLFVLAVFLAPQCRAQTNTQQTAGQPAATSDADTQKKNMDAYLALMRREVRQEKAEIMGATMALSAQDAAKFWPIYSEYDQGLAKLNDQRVANIKEYAKNYDQLSDAEADKLVQKWMAYQKQRAELLAQTYEKIKQALGGVTAARFAMVEHQILTIIDLQIVDALPIAGQGM